MSLIQASRSLVVYIGAFICGILSTLLVIANLIEDYKRNSFTYNHVERAIDAGTVIGCTTIAFVLGFLKMGPAGIGFGMFVGSFIGTFIKRQIIF